jgi:RNA polymerase sigma-70 factor (ECF subfamily)
LTQAIEQALLIDAQQGDTIAYGELQLLLEPAIRRFVGRMLSDPMLIDDMVQEVFIKFYKNIQSIDPPEKMRPYIYRIARNQCYDELRRMGRRESVSLDEEPVELHVSFTQAHEQPKPDDLTHWLLLSIEVREAMDRLPENQRRALILHAEENMTYTEIAEIESVSLGTVKSRIYYAKKNLRQYLSPDTLDVILSEFRPTSHQRKEKTEGESHDAQQSLILANPA